MSKKTEAVKEALPLKAVIYTDGGCRPSRGIGGWGVHGYFYDDEEPKQGSGCKSAILTNKGYAVTGKGKPVNVKAYLDGYGSLIPESTNNQAEITGLLKAIQALLETEVTEVIFRLDSKYTIEGTTNWMEGWKANGWLTSSGEPVSNVDLWKQIDESYPKLLEKCGGKVKFIHVDGHSGDVGNDMADHFCGMAIVAGRKGITLDEMDITEAKGYWSSSADCNKMLSCSKWYFNTHIVSNKSPDGRTIYYIGDHGSDDELYGKPQSDIGYAVLYLKEPDPVLETIRAFQDTVDASTFNNVIIGRLDNILQSSNYEDILDGKDNFIHRPTQFLDLYLNNDPKHGGVQLTKEQRPARLAFNAFDRMMEMECRLWDFISDSESKGVCVTDITSLLYDVDDSKKKPVCKLKPEITTATRSLPIDVSYDTGARKGVEKVSITVGQDIAKRNTLSALAGLFPKVSVVTWREADNGFRYATIIEADGDVGIWAGIYSNLRVLKP